MNRKHLGIAILAILAISGVAYGIISYLTITNEAKLVTIGIEAYEDQLLTTVCSSINWTAENGDLPISPDSTVSKTVYLYNPSTSNTNVTLSFSVEDISPSSAPIYITTDYADVEIESDGSLALELTFHPNGTSTEQISFNLVITGIEDASP